jgi:hypothetical protein
MGTDGFPIPVELTVSDCHLRAKAAVLGSKELQPGSTLRPRGGEERAMAEGSKAQSPCSWHPCAQLKGDLSPASIWCLCRPMHRTSL